MAKTYTVVYNFQYKIDIKAEDAEEAVAKVQQIDWDNWEETFDGPYVEFQMDNLLSQIILDMGIRKNEGDFE